MFFRNTPRHAVNSRFIQPRSNAVLFLLSVLALVMVNGCGSGVHFSTSSVEASATGTAVTMNAGQSIQIPAAAPTGQTWTLAGTGCEGSGCGVTTPGPDYVLYTAPPAVTSQIHVTGNPSGTDSAQKEVFSATVNPAITLNAKVDAASVGTPYTATIAVTGGSNPVQLALADGNLPSGVTFDAAHGVFSGIPKVAGSYPVTIKATDASNVRSDTSIRCTIHVMDSGTPVAVATASLPGGSVGTAYTARLNAIGGAGPYTWSVISGALPAGLSITPAGSIQGTPTGAGDFNFAVQATDANSVSASASLKLEIKGDSPPLTIASTTLTSANVGVRYASRLSISGGTDPYTCSVVSGSLPAGLQLGGCAVYGTPTAAGTSSFRVSVTDAKGASTLGPVSLTVNGTDLSVLTSSLPSASVGVPFAASISVTGGVAPYRCSLKSGSVPAGIALAGCRIVGTPARVGRGMFSIAVTDSAGAVAFSNDLALTVSSTPATLTITSPPQASVGTAYVGAINVSGGSAPYNCAITAGALPSGLTLNGCSLTGTPTAAAISTLSVKVTDSASPANSTTGSITVVAKDVAKTLTISSPPAGRVGTTYVGAISVSGGKAPYTCALAGGNAPAGLALQGCTLTGTPTAAGNSSLSIRATDASDPANSSTANVAIRIAAAPATLRINAPGVATVGSAYTGVIGVGGGTAPYTCTLTGGTLPSGINQNNCALTGTPTASGNFAVGVKVTDSGNPAGSGSATISLVVQDAAAKLTETSPAAATVGKAYTGTIGVQGGTAPYTCSLAGGTLPSGLTMTSCMIAGTPTNPGNVNLLVKAVDSGNPSASVTSTVTMVVSPAPVTLSLTSPAAATAGSAYTGIIGVTGGTAPYACSVTNGTLPSGLSLNGCNLSGTPGTAGTYPLSIKAVDSASPAASTTGPINITVNPATATLTISSPPVATAGTAYNGPIGIAGGKAPYSCSIASGTAPAGLTLNGCTLTGKPTAAGTSTFAIRATDSNSPAASATAPITVTVNAAPATLTLSSPAAAIVGTTYNGVIGVSGGTAPYVCSVASGTLPANLALTGCVLTGKPTTAGTATLSIKATDTSSPAVSTTAPITITVNAAPVTLTLTSPAPATVGTTYSGTIGVNGGTAPYSCSIASGSLPAGLTLNGCTLAGKPTTAGTSTLSIKASDTSSPAATTTEPITVTVNAAAVTLSIAPPPAATVGTAYNGALSISGGNAPYTCSVASGAVPAGLALNGCTFTGTASKAGSYPLSVKVTDSASPANSTTGTIAFAVNAAPVTLTISPPAAAIAGLLFTGSINVSGGTAPYKCTIASGTLPIGLTLSGCNLAGLTVTMGSFPLSITATDSASPANTATAPITMAVNAAPPTGSAVVPHINYTDINVGSGTGGDTGNGVYVRIFGSNFGTSQGSSTATLGGSLVTNCSLCSWSDTQIIAQVGSAAVTGNIVVTVNGAQSNGMPFTVTPTNIVFVSPNGVDSNPGTFASPYKTWRAAFNSVTSNDSESPSQNTVIYLEPGTDVSFDDGRGYKAAISTDIGGSSPTSQLSIVGYPGGTVNVGSSSITNGVHGWGKYVTIANLNIVGQISAIDEEAGDSRMINNSLSCPAPPSGLGGTACVLAETTDPSETWVFQGNNVHDTGGNVDKTYHAVYFSSNVNHADVGWNNVGQNFKGYCRGIMFHATAGSNQFDLHLHDNIVTNSYCDGIGLASVDPSQGTVEIYNNVVAHAALASNPYGVANEAGIAINSDPAGSSSGTVEIYNNTVVDAGAYTTANQNGCFGVVTSGAGIHLTNNICSQPSPSQPYIEKGSTGVSGSNNLWFGAGAAPTWDTAPIPSDPTFVSPTNFSLQPGSPAKGIGTTTIVSPFDILGVPRGVTPSLGAYQ